MGFVKGASGNPKGRPPLDREIRELALKSCPRAFKELVSIMEHPSTEARTRVAAIKEILDRALGKAHQSLELNGSVEVYVARLPAITVDPKEWLLIHNPQSSGSPMKGLKRLS